MLQPFTIIIFRTSKPTHPISRRADGQVINFILMALHLIQHFQIWILKYTNRTILTGAEYTKGLESLTRLGKDLARQFSLKLNRMKVHTTCHRIMPLTTISWFPLILESKIPCFPFDFPVYMYFQFSLCIFVTKCQHFKHQK